MGTTTSCSGQSRTVVNHDCILVLDISVEFKVVTLLVTLIANITKNLQAYPIDLKPEETFSDESLGSLHNSAFKTITIDIA
jgi:hypothetical protein